MEIVKYFLPVRLQFCVPPGDYMKEAGTHLLKQATSIIREKLTDQLHLVRVCLIKVVYSVIVPKYIRGKIDRSVTPCQGLLNLRSI